MKSLYSLSRHVFLFLLLSTSYLAATNIEVQNTDDSGLGSLRDAIDSANDGDTISFNSGINGMTITLDSQIVINVVLTIEGNDTTNTLITTGESDRVFLAEDSLSVSGIKFFETEVDDDGGAIFSSVFASIYKCLFDDCVSDDSGGAIYFDGAGLIMDSRFNECESLDFDGGAIYFEGDEEDGDSLTIVSSTFNSNYADGYGGALEAEGGHIIIDDCIFENNECEDWGGAVDSYDGAIVSLSNSEFSNNYADGQGGALSIDGAFAEIDNCTFSENESYSGGAISNTDTVILKNSSVLNNLAFEFGGGIINEYYIEIRNCDIIGNESEFVGGGMLNGFGDEDFQIDEAGALIINSRFFSNKAMQGESGEGGAIASSQELEIYLCEFAGNQALFAGGAIINLDEAIIRNSTLSGNSSEFGGAILNAGSMELINASITGNEVVDAGGGVFNAGDLLIGNTIVAKNSTGEDGTDLLDDGFILDLGNNFIGDGTGQSELIDGVNGNQVGTETDPIDPLFVECVPEGDSLGGDFNLMAGSPAIDGGKNSSLGPTDTTDLAGNDRIANGNGLDSVDIGAYEVQNSMEVILVLETMDDSICFGAIADLSGYITMINTDTFSIHESYSDAETDINPLENYLVTVSENVSYFVRIDSTEGMETTVLIDTINLFAVPIGETGQSCHLGRMKVYHLGRFKVATKNGLKFTTL